MDENGIAKRCAEVMYSKDAASKSLGIRVDVSEAGKAVAAMTVREDMVNGFDVCHGGIVFTLADTAFAFACNGYDNRTFAAAASIDFLRPARLGDELRAVAREDYRGTKRGLYTVGIRNQHDQVVALFHGRSASRGESLLGNDTTNIENRKKP